MNTSVYSWLKESQKMPFVDHVVIIAYHENLHVIKIYYTIKDSEEISCGNLNDVELNLKERVIEWWEEIKE